MLVEFHNQLRNPEKKVASRVVIYDTFGNAIAVFLQIDAANIHAKVKGEAGFDEALQHLGIRQTVVCDIVRAKELPVLQVK